VERLLRATEHGPEEGCTEAELLAKYGTGRFDTALVEG
jgi:hypothetical protein